MKKRGMNKYSQAEIIVSILLIFIVVSSIVIIWAIVNNTVRSSTNRASSEPLNIKIEVSDVKFWFNGSTEVDLNRGADKGQLTGLKFIFYNKNGNNKIISRTGNLSQKTSKAFFFIQSEIGFVFNDIDKVSVAPVFGENTGIEVSQSDGNIKKNNQKDFNGNKLVYYSEDLRLPPDVNLISWWKFDSDARDSADGNHGTLTNGAYIDTKNKTLILDGINDYVSVGIVRDNVNNIFTASAWIKIANGVSNWKTVIGESCNGFDLGVNVAEVYFGRNCGAGFGLINSKYNLNIGQWYHLALTYNQTNLTLYVNGIYTDIGAGTFDSSAQNMFIGSFNGGSENFKENINEVMIFGKALDKNQILNIYNSQKKNHED